MSRFSFHFFTETLSYKQLELISHSSVWCVLVPQQTLCIAWWSVHSVLWSGFLHMYSSHRHRAFDHGCRSKCFCPLGIHMHAFCLKECTKKNSSQFQRHMVSIFLLSKSSSSGLWDLHPALGRLLVMSLTYFFFFIILVFWGHAGWGWGVGLHSSHIILSCCCV